MQKLITITQQWQVYIPESVRKVVGLTTPGQAQLQASHGEIVIKPRGSSVLKLAGKYVSLTRRQTVSLDRIRDRIDYSRL